MSQNCSSPYSDLFAEAFSRIPLMQRVETALQGRHVLLTGATGFFGQWLLQLFSLLNGRGFDVRVTAVSRAPERFLSRYPVYRRLEWLNWVGSDVRQLRNHDLGRLDLVLHAAADTSAAAHSAPLELMDSIVNGAWSVLDVAVRGGAGRVLFTGSGAQYGALIAGQPVVESSLLACSSASSTSAYAQAKRFQETLGALYADQFGLSVVLTRCFAFAGPGLPLDGHFAIGNFVRDALGEPTVVLNSSGEAVRSYLHGADLAVWLLILLAEGQSGEAYNVGSDQAISIAELAAQVVRRLAPGKACRILGKPEGPRSYYVPDVSKARSLGLGVWSSLDNCIDDMGRWAVCRSLEVLK